jgi:RNA polymerase primary sigma factor
VILINNLQDHEIISLYFREIEKYKPLKADDEKRLAQKIRKGNKAALKKLVTANLRFVVSVALSYTNQGMPLSDLINEGNIGLIIAASRFDENKNFKFVSYAAWWIRHSILQALARQSRIFTVPSDQVAKIYTIGKIKQRLEQKLHRIPNKTEIAFEGKLKVEEVHKIMNIDSQKISLDGPVSVRIAEKPLTESIEDLQSEPPDKKVSDESSHNAIMDVVSSLNEREKHVINDYYGLSGNEPLTLNEIGKNLNITRERVRQIRNEAIRRLKKEDFRNLLQETTFNN